MAEWDVNKVNLCHWSDFYDNIYEHPECPDQYIVDSNKLLDEWVERQSKINEERRRKNKSESGGTKGKSAFSHQEVIVFGE